MSIESSKAQQTWPHAPLVLSVLMVCGLVAAAHWPALSSSAFSFDDGEYLIGNRLVQNPSWDSAWRFLSEVREPSTVHGYYQPLNMISIMFDYAMGGREDNLPPFRRTSLLLHVMNFGLWTVLLYRLFGDPVAAAAAALLAGIHPLTVESIPWVGERKTLLATFFALISLICYVRYAQRRSISSYWVSVAAYGLALLAKPTTTPLPLLMLLLDFWPLRRLRLNDAGGRGGESLATDLRTSRLPRAAWIRLVLEKAPFLVIGVVSAVVTFLSQRATHTAAVPGEYPLTHIPLRICHDIGFYARKILWPVDLAIFYPAPEPFGIKHPEVILGLCISVALALFALVLWRRTRAPAVGLLFFLIAIMPVMGIVRFTNAVGADKYTYFPMLGVGLIVAASVCELRRRSRSAGMAAVGVVAVLFTAEAYATRVQYTHWRNSRSLFANTARIVPGDDLVRMGLAEGLRAEGRFAEAHAEALEAIRLNPTRAENWKILGLILLHLNRSREAIPVFEKALSLEPSAMSHQNLAMALAAVGRHEDAIRLYETALKIDPGLPIARNNLASALLAVGRIDNAEVILTPLLAERPDYARARITLARVLKARGRSDDAVKELERAIELTPQSSEAHAALAAEYAAKGRMDDALNRARSAAALKPQSADYLSTLAVLCASTGRLDEAGELLTRVIELTPDRAEAYHNRALTLRDRLRFEEAARDWEAALRLKPDYADAFYVYGKMLLQQGQSAAAAERFEALLKLEPGNDEVEALLKEARSK